MLMGTIYASHNHLRYHLNWSRLKDAYICVSKLSIAGSNNGLSPDQHQAIIWNKAGTLWIRTLGKNSSETLIEIHTFLFKKICFTLSSGNWRPFCLGRNVLVSKMNWEVYRICFSRNLVTGKYKVLLFTTPLFLPLSHLALNKMVNITQKTFSNEIYW